VSKKKIRPYKLLYYKFISAEYFLFYPPIQYNKVNYVRSSIVIRQNKLYEKLTVFTQLYYYYDIT